jgi:hypothetical protein
MAEHPPYMNAYGSIAKVLSKIIEAKRPDRFTQDYLDTVLALPSSSIRPIIPLLKRIGFLNSDGTPTELYSKFKTESGRKAAMAAGMKIGYPDVFKRNEYAYKLDKPKLTDLIVEMTGLERDNGIVKNVVGTFSALNAFSDFESSQGEVEKPAEKAKDEIQLPDRATVQQFGNEESGARRVGMNFSYTINLNLPETTDAEVFSAIFRALKENMLNESR